MSACVRYALDKAAAHHGLARIPDPDEPAFLRAVVAGEDVEWSEHWQRVTDPQDGDLVLLRGSPQHAGFVIDGYVEHLAKGVEHRTPLRRLRNKVVTSWRLRCAGT